MDKSSHLNYEAIESKIWFLMRVGKNGSSISHLMFVYDLILFGKATKIQIDISDCLKVFCTLIR